jgi:acetyltransferase-like isoleucine patch superfamily enzyme
MFEKTKQRFISWVADELAAMKRRQVADDITLAPTAMIASEAEINNFVGGRERIRIGEHTYVRARLQTYGHGGRIAIGDWCYLGIRTEVWSMDSITIGDRVLIAHDVNIHDGSAHSQDAGERHAHYRHILEKGHPTDWKDMPGVEAAPIIIEDDVWISFGVTILKGVRIGAGSVVAAGSLVVQDIPPGVIYRCEKESVIIPLN